MSTARVIITERDERARCVQISGAVISIGREHDNNVRLESDEHVSRYHALIENRGGDFWISDLNSSNGTTVNDEPLTEPRLLKDNDLISLGGSSTLEFQLADAPPHDEVIKTEVGLTPLPPPPKRRDDVRPSTPTASHEKPKIDSVPVAAVSAIAGILLIGTVLAVLFGTGVLGNKRGPDSNVNVEPTREVVQVNTNQKVYVPPTPDPTPAPDDVEPTPAPTPAEPTGDTNAEAVRRLAPRLVAQITGKSGSLYRFDPAFVAVISRHVDEYSHAPGYYARAQNYRPQIELQFSNKAASQLIPYVVAMSQTKFVEKGAGGVWFASLPQSVVREAGDSTSDITSIALKHLNARLDTFDRDDFMYAVACYGMSDADAGNVKTALSNADRADHYDFWKMVKAGVVKNEQVERVARFIAAGIVCENPADFNLKDKAFSTLFL